MTEYKYIVEGNHPIFQRIDRQCLSIKEAQNIENGLIRGVTPDVSDLKATLKAHSKLEDDIFYPQLDDKLTQEQKELIEN